MMQSTDKKDYILRSNVIPADVDAVGRIVESTGFFNEEEINVAKELVQERLEKGEESGYEFLFLDIDGKTASYACYGRIPCTKGSYDLYWIATDLNFQGMGLGRIIINAVEDDIRKRGGTGVYIETSSRQQYTPTQAFYEKTGYRIEAHFRDFYDTNDGKLVFVKMLN